MKIFVLDKEALSAQFIKSKLEIFGHQIIGETSKSDAVRHCQENDFGMVFIDPSPLNSPRTLVMDMRRQSAFYPYTVLMSENPVTQIEALKFGVNDVLAKPMDPAALDEKLEQAKYFNALVERIGDDSEDFPSAGGIIAKSAFNQLFLSAIDRADRYGENTYLLFISLSSYKEIYSTEGPYAADYTVAKLSQYLVKLRRQSDIAGQTAVNEYGLIMSRPVYETEPLDAAKRFIEALFTYEGFKALDTDNIEINVTLASVPAGKQLLNKTFRPNSE